MTTSLADRINEEISATQNALFASSAKLYMGYIKTRLKGFKKLERKLYQFINNPEFGDFFTEARWSVVLFHLGGTVEYELLGESGPDLRFQHLEHVADFHCKRLRNDPKTAERLANSNEPVPYGNVSNDTISVFDMITSALPQNIDFALPQIVACWSDSERIEEREFEYAIDSIQTAAAEGQYSWLSGVIYKVRIHQHLVHWYNPYSSVPVSEKLQITLQKLKPWPVVVNYT